MNLELERKKRGLTQMACAKACGVSVVTWQMWANDVTKPNEENQKKLDALFSKGE